MPGASSADWPPALGACSGSLFRRAGGADAKRILAIASAASAAKALFISGQVYSQLSLSQWAAPERLPVLMIAGTWPSASRACLKRSASSAYTAPGSISSAMTGSGA